MEKVLAKLGRFTISRKAKQELSAIGGDISIMPTIQWGKRTRTVLDVGCGVASFGGYLLDRNVITMSLAPKDEHEAQIQSALERGIPAFLAVIEKQKLPLTDNTFDVVHCARCRVHWYANDGKPLLELNRALRPGGYFIWSATPVYHQEKREQDDWNAMVALTKSIYRRTVVKSQDVNGTGVVIYQKPTSNSCSPYVILPASLPLGLIMGLPCAQLPGLGRRGSRVWNPEKPKRMALVEASREKLKNEKKQAKK